MILDILFLTIFYYYFPEQWGVLSALFVTVTAAHIYAFRSYRFDHLLIVRIVLWMLVVYELMFQGHYAPALLYSVLLFIHALYSDKQAYRDTSYGSATWARWRDYVDSGLFNKRGLIVGKWGRKWLRFGGEGHILTCAPTGAGKGVSVVIPNLLSYSGSVVVNDIKGENYTLTAAQRQMMGHTIIRLDPFSVIDAHSHTMNWLDLLHPDDPNLVANAQKITDMVIIKDPKHESHWDSAATALLKGVILYVASYTQAQENERTMVEVRRLLVLPQKAFKQVLNDMQVSRAANGVIQNVANMMLQKSEREFAAIISTVHHYTDFLDDPRMAHLLSKSNCNWMELAQKPTSLYLIIPPDKLSSYLGFVRTTLALLMQVASSDLVRKVAEERTLFLIDEFSQLGYMQPVEDAISLIRGYGVTLWLLIQDLSQLEAVYPKWKSFLSNVTILQVFGTNDHYTAEHISELLGKATITDGTKTNHKVPRYHDTAKHAGLTVGRALLTPEEVRKIDINTALLFMQGQRPMYIGKVNYLNEFHGS